MNTYEKPVEGGPHIRYGPGTSLTEQTGSILTLLDFADCGETSAFHGSELASVSGMRGQIGTCFHSTAH
jgi:hypothetical protein